MINPAERFYFLPVMRNVNAARINDTAIIKAIIAILDFNDSDITVDAGSDVTGKTHILPK